MTREELEAAAGIAQARLSEAGTAFTNADDELTEARSEVDNLTAQLDAFDDEQSWDRESLETEKDSLKARLAEVEEALANL